MSISPSRSLQTKHKIVKKNFCNMTIFAHTATLNTQTQKDLDSQIAHTGWAVGTNKLAAIN